MKKTCKILNIKCMLIFILMLSSAIVLSGCGSKSSIDDQLLGSWKYRGGAWGDLEDFGSYVWTFQSNGKVRVVNRWLGVGTVEWNYNAENGKLTIYDNVKSTKDGSKTVLYRND